MTALFLPFPVSVNGMYDNRKGGRAKSDKYKLWLADAQEALLKQLQHKREHVGPVSLSISLKAPDKHLRDLDNTLKAVIDFLVSNHIIIADDSRYVRRIEAEWNDKTPVGCYVVVHDITVCPPMAALNSVTPDHTRPRGRK